MKKFAQILNDKAHWVFEAEEKPGYHESIILVDITTLNPQPQEGWDYDATTCVFTEPIIPIPEPIDAVPTQEEMQMQTLLNTEYLVIMSELTNL